jgi:phosphoenolpyruvate carboxylase
MRLGKTDDLKKFYLNIEKDYLRVGAYLNKTNLQKLATQDDFWKDIIEDVEGIETYLGKELKPITEDQKKHQELTTLTLEKYQKGENISDLIVQSGILRKSLG